MYLYSLNIKHALLTLKLNPGLSLDGIVNPIRRGSYDPSQHLLITNHTRLTSPQITVTLNYLLNPVIIRA